MTSPVSAISIARLRPTLRAIATIGVWQNQPPLPPGAANPADSAATARSQEATSWHPAAVASACTRATTTCGTSWMVCMSSVHRPSRLRTSATGLPATSRKSWPELNTGPSAPSTTPVASVRAASVNAASSCSRWSRASALRRCGRVMVMQIVSPSRSTRGAPSSLMTLTLGHLGDLLLQAVCLADHVDDVAHDLGEAEVLRGEDARHAELAQPPRVAV